jgi:hypothetical protein
MRRLHPFWLLALVGLSWIAIVPAHAADRSGTALNVRLNQIAVRLQGNDSNCDWIAAQNGVQNIGGDGAAAYNFARAAIPQRARDPRESYYTVWGPNGSDRPYSAANSGTAPDAWVGVYEALGYDATILSATPGVADRVFAQALIDRLNAAPDRTFAHLWITATAYNGTARTVRVDETGEDVAILHPFHEVVAFAAPGQPDRVLVADSLFRSPYVLTIDKLAYQLRGFNRVLVVGRNDGSLQDHQRAQIASLAQPYATPVLGGAFLYTARQLWGPAYNRWGALVGPPMRVEARTDARVIVPGEYVQWERRGTGEATIAPLGARMGGDLIAAGVLQPDAIGLGEGRALPPAMQQWAEAEFGSLQAWERAWGLPISDEFWIAPNVMRSVVMRGQGHPLIDQSQGGFVGVLTDRAMLVWHPQHGVIMIPLGRVYYGQLRAELGM